MEANTQGDRGPAGPSGPISTLPPQSVSETGNASVSELPGRLISADATVSHPTPPTGSSLYRIDSWAVARVVSVTVAGEAPVWFTVTVRCGPAPAPLAPEEPKNARFT